MTGTGRATTSTTTSTTTTTTTATATTVMTSTGFFYFDDLLVFPMLLANSAKSSLPSCVPLNIVEQRYMVIYFGNFGIF